MKVIHRLMEKKKRDLEKQLMDDIKEYRELTGGIQHRSQPVEFDIKEDRTIEFPFSSEKPVYRGVLGNEILDHREGAIDFSRLNDAAPLLFNHDVNKPIGVVEKAWTKDQRGYARVRFSDNPFPSEVFNDVKNGILRGVSVGYSVNETREEKEKEDHYRVTSWTPAEISIAVVAADESVGVGRAQELEEKKTEVAMPTQQESSNMETQRNNAVASSDAPQSKPSEKTEMTDTPDLTVVRDEASKKAASDERNRIRSISLICNEHQLGEETKDTLINENKSINEARELALEIIRKKAQQIESVPSAPDVPEKELRAMRLVDGIKAVQTNDWSSRGAGLIREISEEVQLKGGKRTASNSFMIPLSALVPEQRAVYQTGTANVGGNLVADEYRPQDFVEYLYNTSIAMQAGVKTLADCQGDLVIPKRSTTGSTYWLSSQTTAITAGNSTFEQLTASPKNVASLEKYSRQQVLQGLPQIEDLIRSDMTQNLQLALDSAVLNGSGSSGEPTGILNTSNVNSIAVGTNGGAVTADMLINLEGNVVIDNGVVNGATTKYVTNGKVVNDLKKLKDTTNQYLYNLNNAVGGRGPTPANFNGYPILDSMQVPSTLTKGSSSNNCSAVIFGDFSQCLLCLWGGLEIQVGEDSDDFSKLLSSIRGVLSMDVVVRNPVSFGVIKDITTTL